MLLWWGTRVAALGAVATGLANGAEIDLIGYMTARYFGLPVFGRIYGVLYAVYVLGASVSVWLYGRVFDLSGSYTSALRVAAVTLTLSALLFLWLARLDQRRSGLYLRASDDRSPDT